MRSPICYHLWLGLICLFSLSLAACPNKSSQLSSQLPSPPPVASPTPLLTPLPQDPLVQVYFNQSEAAIYREPYRQTTRLGDNLEQIIIDTIAAATSTLDVAVQEFRLPKIAQMLANQHQAGVKVRVILENNYSVPWSEFNSQAIAKLPPRERSRYQELVKLADTNKDGKLSPEEMNQGDTLIILKKAGIPWIDDTADGSKGTGLMHHKFIVADGKTVIVTSANFTPSDVHGDFTQRGSRGNANNLLKIQSAELAKLFTQEFNLMWGDGKGGKPQTKKFGINKLFRPPQQIQLGNTTISVQFDPTSQKIPWEQSGNGLIHKTLLTAKQSIDLALFVFSAQKLVNTLDIVHQRGAAVRALIDPEFAYRSYSEGLDMMGISLADQCQYELENRPWQQPITSVGVPKLPPGDRLHHKFGVLDSVTVITGSHNWTESVNINNDETLLVINSPIIAAHFHREFERLYQGAALGIPNTIQQQLQIQRQQCRIPQATPSQLQGNTNGKVNLNTASQQELETLPGVGPKLAQQIIAARQQKPFTSLKDLDRVPGIGVKMLEQLQNQVTW